jgi:hypothetical protein
MMKHPRWRRSALLLLTSPPLLALALACAPQAEKGPRELETEEVTVPEVDLSEDVQERAPAAIDPDEVEPPRDRPPAHGDGGDDS